MDGKKKKLFCELGPTCYAISRQKEIFLRHLRDLLSKERFAQKKLSEPLPNLVAEYHCHLLKHGPGIDMRLQENKAVNIRLAAARIHMLRIAPGEVFSFCRTVGRPSKRRGFRDGRVLEGGILRPGVGGGLCNLGNTIHRTVLQTPLTVTEFHSHSDALAPDEGVRIPFSAGTSVCYNNIDYRFANTTDQAVQLLVWCDEENLYCELRSEREFPCTYEIAEENHHFAREGENYYRISQIYKLTRDRKTGQCTEKKLVLDNHSKVMFDPALIPPELLLN